MNKLPKLFLIFCTCLFSSCEKDHMGDCFKGTGTIVKESRPVSFFSALDVEKKVDVILRDGPADEITVEAGENIIGGITTRIENNTLYITNENKCNWIRSYTCPVNVYVTTSHLRQIYQRGNGRITSDGILAYDTLYMETWNSGDISLVVASDLLENRQHVSVGDVEVKGQVRQLYVYNNGNGFCTMGDLETKITQVDNQGTGDTYVKVDSILYYGISGIGNIYLYGPRPGPGKYHRAGLISQKIKL
jgi:hypothetical protein